MTWTKLSDDFSDDCWTLSDAAFRLHVEGLIWSNRKLLDLHIRKDDLRRFAKDHTVAPELVAVGWWSDEGETYVIRHHGTYQPTREAVLARQAANSANGKKGGRPKRSGTGAGREITEMPPSTTPETQSVSESQSDSRTHRDGTGRDRTGTYGEVTEDEAFDALHEYRGGPVAWNRETS